MAPKIPARSANTNLFNFPRMSHQPDNIFAGTQVVALVEIRGPNRSLVHPRGAVGVVTRTPAGQEAHYLVRFPDGFEKSLTSAQIEVLKHFKDRLGPLNQPRAPSGTTDPPPSSPSPHREKRAGERRSSITKSADSHFDLEPLLIDQPEDNLDNRLIRQVIVNILASMKLGRQIIVATHNPNLPVLGDTEQAIILRAVRARGCELEASGNLDSSKVVKYITDIMEGGREAFQYRQSIYQSHWDGPIGE
jgi:hypothetical protein